ncbi:MAG TPA: hypothetical protein VF220_01485 [Nitrososphaeraceae archaeon]
MTKRIKNIDTDTVVLEVKRTTRERLADIGTKRDTYDSIIIRLLEETGH